MGEKEMAAEFRVRWCVGRAPAQFDTADRVEWATFQQDWGAAWRADGHAPAGSARTVTGWLDWLEGASELVVDGFSAKSADDVEVLVGLILAPARRLGLLVVVAADCALGDLDDAALVESDFGFAHSLERLRWIVGAGRLTVAAPAAFEPPVPALDDAQQAAVNAPDGVVQIIAPAGSGKSTVLVQRVRELRRRGTRADKILALTFNKNAAADLAVRLGKAGVGEVRAKTFHSLGLQVITDAKIATHKTKFTPLTAPQRRRLSQMANKTEGGVWLDPPEAAALISDLKLGRRLLPAEYRQSLTKEASAEDLTLATIYELYEAQLEDLGRMDFDDMVFRAVRALCEDQQLRERWQSRFERVLVDEYQDIEPTQELLVRLIAAPQDDLFCVGDDDQTLYAFRRASVHRILRFDQLFPSMHRVLLATNYRCPGRIVSPAKALIDCNQVRQPKAIASSANRADAGEIDTIAVARGNDAAAAIAASLTGAARGEVAILARVTSALRPIALAAADLEIKLDGPEQLFEATGARLSVGMHLALLDRPQEATTKQVLEVGRTPARGINEGDAEKIAARLRAGDSFTAAFAVAGKTPAKMLAPGALFEQLARLTDAREVLALLRGAGGLDKWFSTADHYGSSQDAMELEELDAMSAEAKGTPADYLGRLRRQAQALAAVRDPEHGIELVTIHGSKGREWPRVVLYACDEGTLPSQHAMQVSAEELRQGEGIEAERRLAYVAFTRAEQRLEIYHDRERPSRFLEEAGLRPRPAAAQRTAPRPAPRAPRTPQPRAPRAPRSAPQPRRQMAHPSAEPPATPAPAPVAPRSREPWWRRAFNGR